MMGRERRWRMVNGVALALVSAGVFFCAMPAAALEDVVILQRFSDLEARIKTLETKLGEQQSYITTQEQCIKDQAKRIDEYRQQTLNAITTGVSPILARPERNGVDICGFQIGASATGIFQYAVNANNAETEQMSNALDGAMSANVGITRQVGEHGQAYLNLEYGQIGAFGVVNNLNVYPGTNVNRDIDLDGFRISEAWYEHSFLDDRITVTAGKLYPSLYFDENAIASDEEIQFLNEMFCVSPVIDFPQWTPGARLVVTPFDWLDLTGGVFDGDGNWERIDNNLFAIAQVAFRPKLFGRDGNYRFLAWRNERDHTKLMDPTMEKTENFGYGLSFDQTITDDIVLFTRAGMQNETVSIVGSSWSVGLQLGGALWKRPDDMFGMAIGQAIAGHDYREANPDYAAFTQTNFEAYYKFKVNQYLALSPDCQVIWLPNGGDPLNRKLPVTVVGMRGQVDF